MDCAPAAGAALSPAAFLSSSSPSTANTAGHCTSRRAPAPRRRGSRAGRASRPQRSLSSTRSGSRPGGGGRAHGRTPALSPPTVPLIDLRPSSPRRNALRAEGGRAPRAAELWNAPDSSSGSCAQVRLGVDAVDGDAAVSEDQRPAVGSIAFSSAGDSVIVLARLSDSNERRAALPKDTKRGAPDRGAGPRRERRALQPHRGAPVVD